MVPVVGRAIGTHIGLFLAVFSLADVAHAVEQTALDRYVAAPDPSYRYHPVSTTSGDGLTTTVLRMTSQTWLTEKEVDHPVWEHWLTVVRPAKVASSKALLFITGGSRDRGAPPIDRPKLAAVAMASGSVVAELRGPQPAAPLRR